MALKVGLRPRGAEVEKDIYKKCRPSPVALTAFISEGKPSRSIFYNSLCGRRRKTKAFVSVWSLTSGKILRPSLKVLAYNPPSGLHFWHFGMLSMNLFTLSSKPLTCAIAIFFLLVLICRICWGQREENFLHITAMAELHNVSQFLMLFQLLLRHICCCLQWVIGKMLPERGSLFQNNGHIFRCKRPLF